MNNLKLQRILGEEEAEVFLKEVARRKTIRQSLHKITSALLLDIARTTSEKDLTNPQWPLIRAYRDGGKHQLEQFLELFKE